MRLRRWPVSSRAMPTATSWAMVLLAVGKVMALSWRNRGRLRMGRWRLQKNEGRIRRQRERHKGAHRFAPGGSGVVVAGRVAIHNA
jgi:hypothetical protein